LPGACSDWAKLSSHGQKGTQYLLKFSLDPCYATISNKSMGYVEVNYLPGWGRTNMVSRIPKSRATWGNAPGSRGDKTYCF